MPVSESSFQGQGEEAGKYLVEISDGVNEEGRFEGEDRNEGGYGV